MTDPLAAAPTNGAGTFFGYVGVAFALGFASTRELIT